MNFEQLFASRASRMKASEIRELLKLLDQPGIVSFAGGIPDPALFPSGAFSEAYQEVLAGDQAGAALQYSISEGHVGLRQWLADHMTSIGVPCGIENIVITSGSQQALDYLGKVFLSPNDTAMVTWPTYMGALGAFSAYEPRYERLNVHENRPAADIAAEAEAAGGRVKFAYLSADFSNPTGETVDRSVREALLAMAEDLDCAILEDSAYQALRYDGEAVPPILALELAEKGDIDACRTVYLGSFSKTLSPGLRIGWVCAAAPLISQLVLLKQAGDLHTGTLNQMAIAKVAETQFEDHVTKLRSVYGARRDAMLDALEAHMPEGVDWTRPEGGMFVWLTLPKGMDGAEVLAEALKTEKVAFVPGRAFFADGSGGNTIRLSFSMNAEDEMREGVRRLAVVLRRMLV